MGSYVPLIITLVASLWDNRTTRNPPKITASHEVPLKTVYWFLQAETPLSTSVTARLHLKIHLRIPDIKQEASLPCRVDIAPPSAHSTSTLVAVFNICCSCLTPATSINTALPVPQGEFLYPRCSHLFRKSPVKWSVWFPLALANTCVPPLIENENSPQLTSVSRSLCAHLTQPYPAVCLTFISL